MRKVERVRDATGSDGSRVDVVDYDPFKDGGVGPGL